MKKERILAFMLAIVVIVTSIQLPAKAATTEPSLKSGDTNVAEEMLVILDDGNTCLEYKDNTTLNVGPNNRGEFDKISFGETKSFVYSANVTFSELVQAHGSIRLVVGKGTVKSGAHAGKKQYIELCIRPGISGGQEVFFSNGIGLNDSGEGVFDAKQATGFDELGTYRYTIQYENGLVSFWVAKANSSEEAVLVFSNVNVSNTLDNIELQPGFFTQECKGSISDIKIWGDVKKAEDWLESGKTLSTNTAKDAMTMMNLQGIQYGQSDQSYGFSVKASVADNTGINYEGLRFKIATVKQGGNEVDVQIGLRPEISQALILVGGNPVEWPTWSSAFGTQSTYVVKYHSDNSFSFYKDGQVIFKRYKLNDQYTDMKPAIGLGGEFSNYSYSDLQIWGNQVVLKKAPAFNEGQDTNALDGIISSGNGDVNVEGIIYGDSYKFSVKASITDNTGINYEGLRFKLATVKKDGAEQDVLIGIRPELSQALLFVGNNLIGYVDWVSTFSTENTYTIEYNEDNTFSFYKDGVAIFHNCRLSNEYTDMKPSIGLQNEGCTFAYTDMKLWGDVQAISIPEFDSATDTNVMEKVHVSNPLTGVTGKLPECSVSTENESGTNMDFYGIQYGDTYNFSAKALFKDNSQYPEWSHEGLRFKVATAEKDGAACNIEVRVRSSMVVIFANDVPLEIYTMGTEYGKEHVYTLEYKGNGLFSFYKNRLAVISDYQLSNDYKNITPCVGIGSEVCAFSFSEMKLWGDLSVITAPEFNSATDTNIMEKVYVSNPLTGDTGRLPECSVSTENEDGTKMAFYGIQHGDTYNFSTKAFFKDNTQNADWSHEGLRFKVATAEKDGTTYDIEVRVRSSMIVVFANDIPLEIYTMGTEYNKAYLYTLEYKGDGLFSFYRDGLAVFLDYQLSNDYKNITPCVGIGSEVCAFGFSEMKLWGDFTVITAPEFDNSTDTNIMDKVVVGNPITGVTDKLVNNSVSTEDTTGGRMRFYGIQHKDSYNFYTKATLFDNKNLTSDGEEYSWEGLIFQVAEAKLGDKKCTIEVRVRNSLIAVFAVEEAKETLLYLVEEATPFGKECEYTICYKKDKSLEFYKNGAPILYDFDLAKYGCSDLTPYISVGSEVCAFEFADMKLWGNMTVLVAPEFNSATDENIISKVSVVDIFKGKMYKLSSGKISSDKNITGRVDFEGITIEGNYRFYADGKFEDNKKLTSDGAEYNWESLIFRIAKAQKQGKEYTIEVRVRKDWVLVYAVEDNVGEALIYQEALANSYGVTRNYIVNYQRGGIFDLWQNGVALLYGFDITEYGYTHVKPAPGIGCEVCSFTMSNMKLVSEGAKIAPSVPEKPATNGDYADTMWIPSSFEIVYEDGVVSSLTDETYPSVTIDNLPFKADETYVLGFNLNVKKAEKAWMGPRIIFGTDSKGDDLFVYLTEDSIVVAAGAKELYKRSFSRSLNTEYRVDLLVEPDAVSVWVDDILLVEECKIPNKATAKTGILFEQAIATLSNFDMYYTDLVKYVAPKMPEKPVLKNIGANQYNAAEWMKVELNGKTYTGYFGNKLSSKDSSGGTKYTFENLPITDEMSYYYSATYTVHESNEVWKGPRFIFRHSDKAPMYVAITQTGIQILAGSTVVAATPFKMEIGKSYDIVMYSTPTAITVWIDGKCAMEAVDLSEYCKKGVLKAQMGILFELCKASVTNLAIYGDKVVFNSDYVDIDLYNDKFYRMQGIPTMPKDGINLFQNITMIDNSQGSLGASFDKDTNVLATEYKQGVGELVFVDANGSRNLNGLKNESGYVFSFVYEVKDWEAKTKGESGFWVYLNRSSVPSTTQENRIGIGISGDTIMLVAWQDGQVIVEQSELSKRQNNKEYQISVVHGKNWIKLYVDNVLTLVATDLPTYNVQFDFEITNMSSVFKDFMLYEFENSGLSILPTKAGKGEVLAGNTIFDAKEYSALGKIKWPIWLVFGLVDVLAVSIVGISYIVASSKKRRKTGTVEQ